MASSTSFGSFSPTGQYPSFSKRLCSSLTSAGESSTIRTFFCTAVVSPYFSTEQRCTSAASFCVLRGFVSYDPKSLFLNRFQREMERLAALRDRRVGLFRLSLRSILSL